MNYCVPLLNNNSANGLFGAAGGGLYNASGVVTLADSTFSNNSATSSIGAGGGIFNNDGTLTLTNTTFSGNTAPTGGGLYNANSGTVTLANSTFSGNTASTGNGGGIYHTSGTLTLVNSTFSGNTASMGNGGGLYNYFGIVTLANSTFSGNSASDGGGIFARFSQITIGNTIIANSTGGDCSGVLVGEGVNLIEEGVLGCPISGDPNLGPLADNGGSTLTHALLSGSSAIDVGDSAICAAAPVNNLDQRGASRPLDGNGNGIAVCDLGSFEAAAVSGP